MKDNTFILLVTVGTVGMLLYWNNKMKKETEKIK